MLRSALGWTRSRLPGCLLVATVATGCGARNEPGGGAGGMAGAGGAASPACSLGFLGDPSKPVELQLIARGKDRSSVDLTEGGAVPMILPPQGGRIIAVGVRATNVSACQVKLTGALQDTATGQLRQDARTINLAPGGDGWGSCDVADMSTLANVATCPNQWASTAVSGNPFALTVSIADPDGHSASRTITAVPFCAEPSSEDACTCECQKDFKLGQACDAGASP